MKRKILIVLLFVTIFVSGLLVCCDLTITQVAKNLLYDNVDSITENGYDEPVVMRDSLMKQGVAILLA